MTRYHINYEGKIYPCGAKILKCPYPDNFHSKDKVELYYSLIESKGTGVAPSSRGMDQLHDLYRLLSLYELSNEIEKSNSPIEMIVITLKKAVDFIRPEGIGLAGGIWEDFEHSMVNVVYEVLNSGFQIPSNVPQKIARLGKLRFRQMRNGIPEEHANASRNLSRIELRRSLAKEDFSHYTRSMRYYKKYALNEENYEGTVNWIKNDFERFTHDLNTSKMITQPIFYGNIEDARKSIKELNDFELLSTFDDYSVTGKEIEENIKEANYFNYTPREDLSDRANEKVKEWYDRNKTIYDNWQIHTPKRTLLVIEIARELDSRGVYRPDVALDKMLDNI